MKKIQENKKTVIVVGLIIVLLVVLVFLLKPYNRKKEEGTKQAGTETIIGDEQPSKDSDNVESGEGLSVSSPEVAEKKDSEESVEFIGPDDVGDISQTPNKDNSAKNNESANDDSDNEKEENADGTDETVNKDNSAKDDESANNDSSNDKEENADSIDDKVDKEEDGNSESQNDGLDEEATESKTGKYGTFF